jgi:hypothetical protein
MAEEKMPDAGGRTPEAGRTTLSEAEWEEWEGYKRRRAEANAKALPGPMRGAFGRAQEPVKVGVLTFREATLDDFALLDELGNPLAELRDGKADLSNLTLLQMLEAAWLWSHSPEECEGAVAGGADVFRRQARRMRTGLRVSQTRSLVEALAENLQRGFSTAVGYEAKAESGNGESPEGDFRSAPPVAGQTIRSDGGSAC